MGALGGGRRVERERACAHHGLGWLAENDDQRKPSLQHHTLQGQEILTAKRDTGRSLLVVRAAQELILLTENESF